MSKLVVGDRVRHDFTPVNGTIDAIMPGRSTYRYLVTWDDGKFDWYQRKVLIKL